jgi:hypothetical protein
MAWPPALRPAVMAAATSTGIRPWPVRFMPSFSDATLLSGRGLNCMNLRYNCV